MRIYAFFFVFFLIVNLGFPITSSFLGEFLTLVGAFESNIVVTLFASFGMILNAAYFLWLCNRISFGQLSIKYSKILRSQKMGGI